MVHSRNSFPFLPERGGSPENSVSTAIDRCMLFSSSKEPAAAFTLVTTWWVSSASFLGYFFRAPWPRHSYDVRRSAFAELLRPIR